MKASPIIKWAGGKTRVLPELLKRVPKTYGTYYEPFVGGGALFFRLGPKKAVLGDLNEDLVSLYQTLAENLEGVISRLRYHKEKHSDNHYYCIRDVWNRRTRPNLETRAADFLYLNRTCFNGLWRVNKKGFFNVPVGDCKSPNFDDENLHAAAYALSNAVVRHASFEETVSGAKQGDFAYFDPPYDTTFTSYTKEGFGNDAQEALANVCTDLVKRGVRIMVSSSDTPRIRELYADFRIEPIQVSRSIGCKSASRTKAAEVIITDAEW